MQPVSSNSMQKVSEIDLKLASQSCPLFLFGKEEDKIPTCAKESALIPDVRNLQQTSNQTHDIAAEHKITFILIASHFEGATSFEQAQ